MTRSRLVASIACAGIVTGVACSDSSGPGGPAWQALIGRAWNVAATSEAYVCKRVQATADWNITGFRATLPPGVYKVIVTTSSNTTTGDFNCTINEITTETALIYFAGAGTQEFVFPNGAGLHVTTGQYVLLVLHLVNPTGSALSGTATVEAYNGPASGILSEAEMMLAGDANFSLAAMTNNLTATGGCTFAQAETVFAIIPSMKVYGISQLVEKRRNAATTIHNGAWDDSQHLFVVPSPLATFIAGDTLQVTCTYNNTTNATINFGPLIVDEWCFTGVYRYPVTPGGVGITGCVSFTAGPTAMAVLGGREPRPFD